MLRWYGDMAQEESIRRVDELSAADDLAGVAIWLRIIDAVSISSPTQHLPDQPISRGTPADISEARR
jgi:hypothetical protein